MKIISFDPGKTTGWAQIQGEEGQEAQLVLFGTTRDLTLIEILDEILWADVVVFENFLVRPKQARRGSFDWDPMITPQVIGALKALCHQHEKPIVEQNPSIKPVGYGFANLPYQKGKKGTHAWDAIAHGFYYAVKSAGLKPVST